MAILAPLPCPPPIAPLRTLLGLAPWSSSRRPRIYHLHQSPRALHAWLGRGMAWLKVRLPTR